MFNLRGQHQYLYQQNMKAVIPVLLSTRGYGIFLDSCSLMTFHDDAFGSYLWSDVDDELDYYFVYGPEFDQIIAELRALTGQAPLLPKWAYGYIQSKERYASQSELLENRSGISRTQSAAGRHRAGLEIVDGRTVGAEDFRSGALPQSRSNDGRLALLCTRT